MNKISAFASVACVVAAMAASPGLAADMPLKAPRAVAAPIFNWTGFYYGGFVGAGASNNVWNSADQVLGGLVPFSNQGVSGGAIGGVTVGYNYQSGNMVLGIEADGGFSELNGFASCGIGTFTCATRNNWLGTLGARVGYASGNTLYYAKAGGAVMNSIRNMQGGNFANVLDGSEVRAGWMVGAGAEYAFNPGWSAKLEYNYLNFGTRSLVMTDQFGQPSNVSISQDAHLVKLGLNYHLGASPLAIGSAATNTPLPQWSWTGFYAGVHVGGAFGRNEWKSADGVLAVASLPIQAFPGSGNTEGLLGGGQIGYNYQAGSWVFGVEASASAADISGDAKCATNLAFGTSFTCNNRINALGTLTGRFGTTWGNLLVYSKAGAAWAVEKSEARSFFFNNLPTESATRWGFTWGSGLEYAFTQSLSAFAEYNSINFGTQTARYVDQTGQTSNVGFAQRLDVVKVGVNYRFGGGSGPLSANAADPALFKSVPMLASGWSLEVGSRFFISSNRMQKDLYDPVQTDRLNSRLIYADQTGQTLETFFRFDHQTGVFAKGTFGVGNMSGGKLNDEDFPVNVYSNTVSDMKNGRLMNGSADIGYNVINQPGSKLGAYVGYRSFYLRGNGYGCAQIATDGTCAPAIPTTFLGLSETESWRGVAVGLNTQTQLTDKLRLEVDAAYMPYMHRAGFDNHWFRADINPLGEVGRGWGTQVEAILNYAVTDRFSVGAGGRYTFLKTDSAYVQFPGSPTVSPLTFYTQSYGGFVQASYKFGDVETASAAAAVVGGKGIHKAPPKPVAIMVANWTGFYIGGSLGSGAGRANWADPYAPPVSGDRVTLGGAIGGGQIGYNYQTGAMVVGVEAAGNLARITGTETCFGNYPVAAVAGLNCGTTIDALATFTGRLGYAFNSALLYVKGGAAWARQTHSLNTNGFIGGAISNVATNGWGWTVGAGVEYALTTNWSVGLEYKYVDLASTTVNFTPTLGAIAGGEPVKTSAHLMTMGVNYRFGAPGL